MILFFLFKNFREEIEREGKKWKENIGKEGIY